MRDQQVETITENNTDDHLIFDSPVSWRKVLWNGESKGLGGLYPEK